MRYSNKTPRPVEVEAVLGSLGVRPVLVDLGASGSAPEVWSPIADKSIYVGFDPDSREMNTDVASSFFERHIVPFAITAGDSSEVEFFLTRSPFCSSTLRPDIPSLDAYLFAGLFEVERVANVPASRLEDVLAELGIDQVHWFKADTQGTDLRIFRSLSPAIQDGVLAIDMEPGLIDAYIGEDLFEDVHRDLTERGFWPSRLQIKGAVRMSRSAHIHVASAYGEDLASEIPTAVRQSPGWCEARYLRSVASLADRQETDWILTWIFAMVDDQPGFSLDLAYEFGRRFENTKIAQLMEDGAIASLRNLTRLPVHRRMWRRFVPASVRKGVFGVRRRFAVREK